MFRWVANWVSRTREGNVASNTVVGEKSKLRLINPKRVECDAGLCDESVIVYMHKIMIQIYTKYINRKRAKGLNKNKINWPHELLAQELPELCDEDSSNC